MGSGKSQYAIQKMNEDKDNDYIYITPYLDEIKRIRENCKSRKFVEPKENEEHRIFTKSKSLKVWLKTNANIATTHSLFKIIDEETGQYKEYDDIILAILDKNDKLTIFDKNNNIKVHNVLE